MSSYATFNNYAFMRSINLAKPPHSQISNAIVAAAPYCMENNNFVTACDFKLNDTYYVLQIEHSLAYRCHSAFALRTRLHYFSGEEKEINGNSVRSVLEVRPPALTSTSEPLAVFDGTTRLYICYLCPFAQRAWLTRNCKGLQDKIKLVPIDLKNRPSWYKEKVYPQNKVPSLEHNGKVLGESLDLIRYIDANFEGPALFPSDPAKREFGEQLISHVNTFTSGIYSSFKGDTVQQTSAAFDFLENALGKFDDGPFFLGQFSSADIAYVSFLERFEMIFSEIFKHDITAGRPKLATWIEEASKIDGYKQTKVDRKEYLEAFKKKILA